MPEVAAWAIFLLPMASFLLISFFIRPFLSQDRMLGEVTDDRIMHQLFNGAVHLGHGIGLPRILVFDLQRGAETIHQHNASLVRDPRRDLLNLPEHRLRGGVGHVLKHQLRGMGFSRQANIRSDVRTSERSRVSRG